MKEVEYTFTELLRLIVHEGIWSRYKAIFVATGNTYILLLLP